MQKLNCNIELEFGQRIPINSHWVIYESRLICSKWRLSTCQSFLWWLKDCLMNLYACFCVFVNEIFDLLIYRYIHKPVHHTQTPKISWTFNHKQFGSLLTIIYKGLPNCQIGKAFRKTLMTLILSIDRTCALRFN